jgi:hypothetical protein
MTNEFPFQTRRKMAFKTKISENHTFSSAKIRPTFIDKGNQIK